MAKIHTIVVADLDDPNIGISCGVDLKAVRELMSDIAGQTGLELQATEVTGRNFSSESIVSAVRGLSPDVTDTVVFYYSGHGARGLSKADAWPVLSLGSHEPPFGAFDLAWIYRNLHQKTPRMLLMFVDCCQQPLPDEYLSEESPEAGAALPDVHSTNNYRLLFHSFQGEVLLMSCKPGQLSGCNQVQGGFFTATFLRALRSLAKNPRTPSWEAIAGLGSAPPRSSQEPIWKVISGPLTTEARVEGMEPFPGTWNLGQTEPADESPLLHHPRALGAYCSACGEQLSPESRFCAQCGTPVAPAGEPAKAAAPPPPADIPPAAAAPQSKVDSILQQSEERIARARKEAEERMSRLLDRFKTP